MKRAALLCPGPSLASLQAVPECDLVIAVNRAATRFPCHVWAALDYPMIRDNRDKLIGTPALLTGPQTWADISHRGWFAAATVFTDLAGPPPDGHDGTWMGYSALCGLAYAIAHADAVEVYGADMAGIVDWDGVKAGENRNDQRWVTESYWFARLVEWAAGRGVTVTRHHGTH